MWSTTQFLPETTKPVKLQTSELLINDVQDLTTWYAQFVNFAKAMSKADKDRLVAINSYLDTDAFTTVENLNFVITPLT